MCKLQGIDSKKNQKSRWRGPLPPNAVDVNELWHPPQPCADACCCCLLYPESLLPLHHRLHPPNNANQLPTPPTITTLTTLISKQGIRHMCCNIHHQYSDAHSPSTSPLQGDGVSHCFHSSMWHRMQCIACLMVILIPPSLSKKKCSNRFIHHCGSLGGTQPTQLNPTHTRSQCLRAVGTKAWRRNWDSTGMCVPKWLFSKLWVGLHHCVDWSYEGVSFSDNIRLPWWSQASRVARSRL